MTVRELISLLERLDPDLPVAVDIENERLAPVVRVRLYDVPAAAIEYDPDGSL